MKQTSSALVRQADCMLISSRFLRWDFSAPQMPIIACKMVKLCAELSMGSRNPNVVLCRLLMHMQVVHVCWQKS